MKKIFTLVLLTLFFQAKSQSIYFPPNNPTSWDTLSPAILGWCPEKVDSLISYLGNHNTSAFILLKDGKIVIEHYYGTFTADSTHAWNSAGKSLTGFLVGLAQEQGYLNIHDSLPKYLGHGFSTCGTSGEDSIRIINQLSMTTGFNDLYGGGTSENHCTDDSCLVCIAAPGTRWAYHNAPYSLIDWVIDSATHVSVNAFKTTNLASTTGITGLYISNLPSYPYDHIYFSTARSFARFGLLILANGIWNGTTIMHDTAYLHAMLNSSQSINPLYGYLWWLNGKSSYHLPSLQFDFPGMLVPDAPADMLAALGKNDQILNVIPSMGIVWIRMGNAFSVSKEVGNTVDDSIWVKLNNLSCTTLSAQDLSRNNIQVFPNPFTSGINLTGVNAGAYYILTNVVGQVIYTGSNIKNYDMTLLSRGIYFLNIEQNQHVQTFRLVK